MSQDTAAPSPISTPVTNRKRLHVTDVPEKVRQAKCPKIRTGTRVFYEGVTKYDDRLHDVVSDNVSFTCYGISKIEKGDEPTQWTFTEEKKEKILADNPKLVQQKIIAGTEILALFKRDEHDSEELYLNERFITIEEFAKHFGALGSDCGTTTSVYYVQGGGSNVFRAVQKLDFCEVTSIKQKGVEYDDEGHELFRFYMIHAVEEICLFPCSKLPNCSKTHVLTPPHIIHCN